MKFQFEQKQMLVETKWKKSHNCINLQQNLWRRCRSAYDEATIIEIRCLALLNLIFILYLLRLNFIVPVLILDWECRG